MFTEAVQRLQSAFAATPNHVNDIRVVATDTAVAQALTDDVDMLKAVHELSRSIF